MTVVTISKHCYFFHRKETEVILDLTKVITQQIIAASKITTEEQSSAAVDIESVLHDHLNPKRAAAKVAGGASKGLNLCCQI